MAHSTDETVQAQPAQSNWQALPPLMPNSALRWDVVSRLLPDPLGDVLEVGCGQGASAINLADYANSETLEIQLGTLRLREATGRPPARLIWGDRISLPDGVTPTKLWTGWTE